jgi:hypothetical protein
MLTTILIILALILLVPVMIGTAFATTTSNHAKYCSTLKDKKTRSIICPDVFKHNETSFVPGG